ncbi:MAG: 4-carboxy-4-hydroxy-2-oxoadipate aldolase/oxaloacetate decarboxylase [Lachnoclostridium edouardi]|uniref:4-carboxy-4-hydroxy-2-oxoadipate aldolase/oxaloacetate decarboxylase n=1 Tax=Lachnoclostridium edouardi TaxID=1926283 RepID=UPI0026DB2642|nr:4-carboxy-4-hydroxy-2-oxoadipate aldolase/oxaloacetate decarboxylase [Lachnoclostridium edouardi]MDO4278825.1 4-carboxy-4-hydroxy-2-oxoadipate aldolase/oxaloacetate decarboxylase [Lachnoclostridium edouardi]
MKADILKNRPEVSDEVLKLLADLDVATVHEAMGRQGAMNHNIRPVNNKMKMCGRALTVKCHSGDNLMLIKAVNMANPGDVIIADMGPIVDNGPFGEVLAVECMVKKVRGLVISCAIRDSEAIINMGFPVFSAGISVMGTSKAAKGTINHPVVVGGVIVEPGDLILGDRDGIVTVPYKEAKQIIKAAEKRRDSEKGIMERLKKGESLFHIYGYQAVLDQLNITEEQEEVYE